MDDSKIETSGNPNDIEWKIAAFWLVSLGFLAGFWYGVFLLIAAIF